MDELSKLWANHGLFLLATLWPVASAIVNFALRKKTPEQWVRFANQHPRAAAIIRLLRAAGLDPNKTITSLQQFLAGKAKEQVTKDKPS